MKCLRDVSPDFILTTLQYLVFPSCFTCKYIFHRKYSVNLDSIADSISLFFLQNIYRTILNSMLLTCI